MASVNKFLLGEQAGIKESSFSTWKTMISSAYVKRAEESKKKQLQAKAAVALGLQSNKAIRMEMFMAWRRMWELSLAEKAHATELGEQEEFSMSLQEQLEEAYKQLNA